MNKAIRINGARDIEIIDLPMPELTDSHAVLKVKYGGICGSDFKVYLGSMNNAEFPLIAGHEFVSEIVEIGKNDYGLEVGMEVIGLPYFGCGECWACKRGYHNGCPTNRTMGVRRDGGFRQYISMPVSRCIPGKGIDAKTLALVEPFQASLHFVKMCDVKQGDTVVVYGAGPIGIFAVTAAKLRGAKKVYSVDISDWRLNKALTMGADGVFNPKKGNLQEWANEVTNGELFDKALDCVGNPSVYMDCINTCTIRGTVGILGVTKEPVSFDYSIISMKELKIVGARNGMREDFEELIDKISTDTLGYDIKDMITGVYDYTEVEKVMGIIEKDNEHVMKMLLKFDI